MNINCSRKFRGRALARRIIRKSLAALALLATAGIAYAQERDHDRKDELNFNGSIPGPTTPDTITSAEGTSAFLLGHGVGTQGYLCLPSGPGAASWTVNNPRPEATLFTRVFGEPVQIITHFLSPLVHPNDIGPKPSRFGDVTWQSSSDSSQVWGQKKNSIPAGTHASCPNGGSIDCLLLQVIGADEGPAGGKLPAKTSFIQRLNTKSGSAPATGCLVPGDVGKQVLVPCSADYCFFHNDQ